MQGYQPSLGHCPWESVLPTIEDYMQGYHTRGDTDLGVRPAEFSNFEWRITTIGRSTQVVSGLGHSTTRGYFKKSRNEEKKRNRSFKACCYIFTLMYLLSRVFLRFHAICRILYVYYRPLKKFAVSKRKFGTISIDFVR